MPCDFRLFFFFFFIINTLKGWQSNMIQKLGEVLKNQRQQIEMLSKLLARVYKK